MASAGSWTSWRPPSSARSRPSSDTRGCELRNLQWLVPTGRPCVSPRYFARVRPTGDGLSESAQDPEPPCARKPSRPCHWHRCR
jgi:hypothetical protein